MIKNSKYDIYDKIAFIESDILREGVIVKKIDGWFNSVYYLVKAPYIEKLFHVDESKILDYFDSYEKGLRGIKGECKE